MKISRILNPLKEGLRSFIPTSSESVKEAVIKSSFINLLARGFGYLKNVSIAILLGFSYETDAFFMAVSLIGLFLIFADVFDSIGVPNLVRARLKGDEEFKRLSGLLLSFTLILTLIVGFLALIFYPLVLKIPRGFSEEALSLTKKAYFLLLPYLLLNFIFHHFGAVLRSTRRFTAYFVGEALFSFSTFLFISLGLFIYRSSLVLPISFSLAQLISTLYMLYVGRPYIHFNFFVDATFKRILQHFFYLSALYGVFHLFILVDRAFASLLQEKSVSALTYGLTVAGIPKGILKLEHMAITSLSEVGGSLEKLNFYLKKIFILTLPLTLILFFFADLLVSLFFGYGAFSRVDIVLTAEATRYYALSLPLMFIWPILYRVFQIREWLKAIFFIALLGVMINGALNYLLVIYFKLGLKGICLGTFGAYIFLCISGYALLSRKRSKL